MGLNIKNQRVHDLARLAAKATGKTQTGAIEEALELLLADRGHDPALRRIERKVDIVHGIVARYADLGAGAPGEVARVEDLYGADGMPR